ncbi:YpmS family protein [Solibacillus sp. MA9]|uniref:YpmS family protein n=1 Tax=Solibacillus palustris TaxID=2908203 RepID=A0ABS9UF89_9BACL|nr:YpmS family protein [Solibacillus sp. MA9]MCH7322600.1 YpmS family protein [Solibacillus sp. MA9]
MNKWKVAFFVLAGAIIMVLVSIVYLATSDVEQSSLREPTALEGNILTVETTAKEFEAIAKQYLMEAMNNSPVPVELAIEEKIYLYSTLTVFNFELPIQMDFNPVVSDGNIILKQDAVHVGKINIQPKQVLKLMKDAVEFPSWITVQPNDEQIYVDLSRINIASGSRVRAQEIDLENDKIVLQVVIPNETK